MWQALQNNYKGITAIIAITGILIGAIKYVKSELKEVVKFEIAPLKTEIKSINEKLVSIDKRIFRLEDHLISKKK